MVRLCVNLFGSDFGLAAFLVRTIDEKKARRERALVFLRGITGPLRHPCLSGRSCLSWSLC